MSETGFVMRVGDADDYHVEADIKGVVARLKASGIKRLTGRRGFGKSLGVIADGFEGDNYISLFWGKHSDKDGSSPERELMGDEFDQINEMLGQRKLYVARYVSHGESECYLFLSDGHFLDNDYAIVDALGLGDSFDREDGDELLVDEVLTSIDEIPFIEKV